MHRNHNGNLSVDLDQRKLLKIKNGFSTLMKYAYEICVSLTQTDIELTGLDPRFSF